MNYSMYFVDYEKEFKLIEIKWQQFVQKYVSSDIIFQSLIYTYITLN